MTSLNLIGTTPECISSVQKEGLIAALEKLLGRAAVITSQEECEFYSLDFSEEVGLTAMAVVKPVSAAQVSAIVKLAAAVGVAVNTRGGAMSYTKGHVPARPGTIILDATGLNRVLEINTGDRFVTVEPGVTWAALRAALLGTGFRVPYLGTLSGNHATIGGGLSQNATGMGRMTLAEHVLGLEVVLGTGEIVKTGSWATSGTRPFYRYNGPDLTGMFLCDSGAFGIKTRVHLILEPVPKVSFVCVSFPTRLAMVAAQVAIAQTGLQTEAFAFDDRYIREYANHPSPPKQETRRMVRQYLSEHPARIRAYRNLLRAWHPSGLGFLKDKCNVMYFIAEAHHQTEADRMAREIAAITRKHGGYQMPTSIPFGLRYGPFLNVGDLMANSAGEVNFPINGKFAATQAVDVMRAFEEFLSQNKATLEKHEIRIACNTLLHGHFWGIEPIINWQRPLTSYRAHFANDEKRARSANIPENSERTRIAIEMRYRLTKLLRSMGSLHVQWAKAYPYAQALDGEATWDLLNRLKQVNDPDNILNPGVLGLGL